MKKARWAVAVAALGAIVFGAMLGEAQQKKYTIALIPGLTTDGFYITMHKGAEAAAQKLGVNLIFQGGPEFSPTTQIPVLNAIIARKPDAILIAPTDKQQLIAPLKRAFDAGIKIITVDTFIGENGQYQTGKGDADFPLSYVASDNVEGGRIAARALAKAIGEKGKVYVSNVKPGISTTDQREQGFKEEMKKYPGITVLETQYNDDDANKAAAQFAAVLARNPDLAGVFGANLFSAEGAANGVKNAGKRGVVKVAAFDCPESIVNEIKNGIIDMSVCQHPYDMGMIGVQYAVDALNGKKIPTRYSTGYTVIDKANADSAEAKAAIYSSK
ncbi:ABC transporter substrate-binding protein [Meiothermus granaticius]|uniref:Ribose import binding protein RbsB n=1 Tax=Meiothermus granaticius NBRC 107808 TaxID=1227551 RepID=A0A399F6W5_9DEIN|nr:ABC transporter substrate-binding protein [Meiothermus granaticius]MCL6527446.1 substrate-binding domain-containing protein [Thermaceae bacterium]RIH92404.1 Ribose import binding protein RbsB [Meiothermus granaticius NBRC 107808]GEM87439.1 ribose ABC transporter substrate-binding protein [Meiothermus granaticius NBRC 107808]